MREREREKEREISDFLLWSFYYSLVFILCFVLVEMRDECARVFRLFVKRLKNCVTSPFLSYTVRKKRDWEKGKNQTASKQGASVLLTIIIKFRFAERSYTILLVVVIHARVVNHVQVHVVILAGILQVAEFGIYIRDGSNGIHVARVIFHRFGDLEDFFHAFDSL